MLKDQIHPKKDTINIVAAYCMMWLDQDEEDLDGHDAEDPLPGFSEVLDEYRIATPSTNLADESSSDSSDEEEMSSGQAALLKVKAARDLMMAKKAQEDARNQGDNTADASGATVPPAVNPEHQNEVVMDP